MNIQFNQYSLVRSMSYFSNIVLILVIFSHLKKERSNCIDFLIDFLFFNFAFYWLGLDHEITDRAEFNCVAIIFLWFLTTYKLLCMYYLYVNISIQHEFVVLTFPTKFLNRNFANLSFLERVFIVLDRKINIRKVYTILKRLLWNILKENVSKISTHKGVEISLFNLYY